ncbi:MAG: hypothetical protein WC356_02625 [Candidatus Micrarchaeia archaeon]|jgi:hypothetical protein
MSLKEKTNQSETKGNTERITFRELLFPTEINQEFVGKFLEYKNGTTIKELIGDLSRCLALTHSSVKSAYFISILKETIEKAEGKNKITLIDEIIFMGLPNCLANKKYFKGDIDELKNQLNDFIEYLKKIIEETPEEDFEGFKEFFENQINDLLINVKQ